MDQVFEGTPKAELRLEGRKVIRGDISNDWASRLQWKVFHDGKLVGTYSARAGYTYEHPGEESGRYEIVLELWKYEGYVKGGKGKYIEISNKVAYTV